MDIPRSFKDLTEIQEIERELFPDVTRGISDVITQHGPIKLIGPAAANPKYRNDVERLRSALNATGYDADYAIIAEAYSDFSAWQECSWIPLSAWESDAEIVKMLIDIGYLVPDPQQTKTTVPQPRPATRR